MQDQVFNPQAHVLDKTFVTAEKYDEMYSASVNDPDTFWAVQAKRLDWIKFPAKIKNTTFAYPDVSIKWFEDGVLNVAANCVDRHLPERANDTAIIWEGDEPGTDAHITYQQLHDNVGRFSNVLKQLGVKKGDRVTIYTWPTASRRRHISA